MDFIQHTSEYADLVRDFRRWFHRHPEAGFEEFETSNYIKAYLNKNNIPFQAVGATGVIAELDTGRPGKTIALRADIDALPILEANDLEFKSENEGFMHACGHDSHAAILLASCKFFQDHLDEYNGKIRFLFQPAEESPPGGALDLMAAGALDGVDHVYGLHCNPEIPVGSISVINGPMMAAADRFKIKVIGSGGHGASPHQTVDAVILAAQLINNLQVIVSRNVNPQHAAVMTIGKINGGFRFNVIAETVELEGTVRTLLPEVRKQVEERMEEIIKGTVLAHGATYEFDYEYGYPPLRNHVANMDIVRKIGYELLGQDQVVELPFASMGGEDFSYYLEEKPGAFFRLGIMHTDQRQYPLHNDKFNLNEAGLEYGIKMFAGIVKYHTYN